MRFLLSRRWALFALTVVVMAYAALLLGQWQFHRLAERKHTNGVTAANLAQLPVPVNEVMSADHAPGVDDEWKRVTVHGTWDDAHSIVLKYQTRDQGPGVDVVTPLRTDNGAGVLVDRGWMSTPNSGDSRPRLPATTPGLVTVTGYVRQDATGGATRVADGSTRAVSSATISRSIPYPLYQGFVDLAAQSPAPAHQLGAVELPDDTSNGPHFFYGLQWWFFGVLAVFGFCFLAWDELRRHREERAARSSQRPQHPAVDGQHRAVHEG